MWNGCIPPRHLHLWCFIACQYTTHCLAFFSSAVVPIAVRSLCNHMTNWNDESPKIRPIKTHAAMIALMMTIHTVPINSFRYVSNIFLPFQMTILIPIVQLLHLALLFFTFASIIPSCSFTFASIIPSCSFTFTSIIKPIDRGVRWVRTNRPGYPTVRLKSSKITILATFDSTNCCY